MNKKYHKKKKKNNNSDYKFWIGIFLFLLFCYILYLLPLFISIILIIFIIFILIYLFLRNFNFVKKKDKKFTKKEEFRSLILEKKDDKKFTKKEEFRGLILEKKEITKLIKEKEIIDIFNNHLNKTNFENFKINVSNPNHQEFQRMGSIIDIFLKEEWSNGNFLKEINDIKYSDDFLNDFLKIKNNIKENKLIENLFEYGRFVLFDRKFKEHIGNNLILGTADLIIDDNLIEIKTSLKSKIEITWIYQLLFYVILWENQDEFNERKINNIKILNTRAKNIINIPLNDLIYDLNKLKKDLFIYFENN